MNGWQALTKITIAASASIALASVAFSTYYLFSPFTLVGFGVVILAPDPLSMEAWPISSAILVFGMGVSYSLLSIQQWIAGQLAARDLKRVKFVASEIRKAFGADAESEYLAAKFDEVTRNSRT